MRYDSESVQAAIKADGDALQEAWENSELSNTNPECRDGFFAWEWCLRQLCKKMPEDPALMLRQVYMQKSRRLGTYGAIAECLNGDVPTFICT